MDWNLGTAARTLWQEARGEPLSGQQAVAHSFINRRDSGRWGDTLGCVCLAHSQYSAWGPVTPSSAPMLANFRASCVLADDDPELITLASIISVAETTLDPTGGATHYYAKSITPPAWATAPAVLCGQFGNQIFWKGVK